jgi:RNA polymerase sigma factor (sigma-70 family)
VEGDERAWQEVYTRYRPLVTVWARRITSDPDEVDAAVHAAFTRLWQAIGAAKFARFPNLSSLLQYLKLCVRGAVLDARRDKAAQAVTRSREELLAHHDSDVADLDVDVEAHLIHDESRRDLWALLRREVPERRERLLLHLSYVAGLPPREIVRRFPEHFGSAEEIYRLKWAICERLRRCDTLRGWWMDQ